MHTNSSLTASRVANYNLSSSYPSIKPLFTKDLPYSGFLNLDSCNSFTRSWGSSYNAKCSDYLRGNDVPGNSDLQPLTWLQRQSIIDIVPLDIEEESRDDSLTPGHDALIDPQLCCPREEVETQENSNIQDFVRFQAQRNNLSNQRLALRQHNSFCPDLNHNYSYKINGHTKPNLSYTQLIFMAIETCKDRAMTVNDIYQWCEINYPYYKHIGPSWKNSLRHNLSINKSFRRMPRDGQMSIGKCELLNSDDVIDDMGSQRDNKQGGPGRGAYWIVDDKERKNLLESIYRAQQTMPLTDRNERIDQPFSLVVNPPNTGPLLCIDGRFTDASTYLQSRRSDDETSLENRQTLSGSPPPLTTTIDPGIGSGDDNNIAENEYSAMMRALTMSSSPDVADISVKLSTSCNSQFSKTENPDSDSTKPKLKNRRKSTHEKVRSYLEVDSINNDEGSPASPKPVRDTKHSMKSVNVIVAPHFDHIYARYQQFLPPAISSDMEKSAFAQQQLDHDSDPDAEFLKNGYREDDDDNDEDNDDVAVTEADIHNQDLLDGVIKTEKIEAESLHDSQAQESPVLKLSASNVAFATRRKIKRTLSQRTQSKVKRMKLSAGPIIEVKQEMIEPSSVRHNDEPSDGYNTDSTMPMMAKNPRRSSRVQTAKTTASKAKARIFNKRNSKLAIAQTFNGERRYRSKRKRTRPLRIDENRELSAIRFLANLERRHQQLRNIDNLYKLNSFLNITKVTSSSPPLSQSSPPSTQPSQQQPAVVSDL